MQKTLCYACDADSLGRLGTNHDFPESSILVCKHCGFISTYPAPAAASLAAFYDFGYSQRNKGRTREFTRYDERARAQLRFLCDAGVNELTDKKVIDIGCGPGSFLVAAERMGARVKGFEADSAVADVARSRLSPDAVIVSGLFDPDTLEHSSCDVIMMSHVLEHVPEPMRWTKKIMTILRPGGIAFVEVPSSDRRRTRRFIRRFDRGSGHLNFFTLSSLVVFIRRAGGEILHSETAGPDHRNKAIRFGQPTSRWDAFLMRADRKLTYWLRTEREYRAREATLISMEPRSDGYGLYLRVAARRPHMVLRTVPT